MSRPKYIKETRFEYLQRTIKEATISECQIWPFGAVGGYGVLAYSPYPAEPALRKVDKVHRLAYFLVHGEFPLPLGRHTCDTPLCFNHLHIIPGSDADNATDRKDRGRNGDFKGEKNPAAKLTDALVLEIRRRSLTERRVDIARALGLSRRTIIRAVRGDLWKHLPGAEPNGQHYEWLKKAIAEHGENSACLIWPFPVSERCGGAALRVDGVKRKAHHVAYQLLHGEYPKPTGARTCGDDLCVNPHHTFPSKKLNQHSTNNIKCA
jgi:hypothetical protein